jgi:hypothetical protein
MAFRETARRVYTRVGTDESLRRSSRVPSMYKRSLKAKNSQSAL